MSWFALPCLPHPGKTAGRAPAAWRLPCGSSEHDTYNSGKAPHGYDRSMRLAALHCTLQATIETHMPAPGPNTLMLRCGPTPVR